MSSSGNEFNTYAQNAHFWIKIIREGLDRYRTELTDSAVLAAVRLCSGLDVLDAGHGEGYIGRPVFGRRNR